MIHFYFFQICEYIFHQNFGFNESFLLGELKIVFIFNILDGFFIDI